MELSSSTPRGVFYVNAVISALQHSNGAKLSDRQIAEHVGVSNRFVGNMRKDLEVTVNGSQSDTRTGPEPLWRSSLSMSFAELGEFYRGLADEVEKNIATVTA